MLELRQTFEPDSLADGHDATVLAEVFPASQPVRVQPEPVDLELPGWIWTAMAGCYAVFFAGLIAATGRDGEAIFALVISIAYALIYFGTAGQMFGLRRPPRHSAFARGLGPLQTWTGPMDTRAVAAQILSVPACLAFFGVAIAIIRFALPA
jgi:hypothetical protein